MKNYQNIPTCTQFKISTLQQQQIITKFYAINHYTATSQNTQSAPINLPNADSENDADLCSSKEATKNILFFSQLLCRPEPLDQCTSSTTTHSLTSQLPIDQDKVKSKIWHSFKSLG